MNNLEENAMQSNLLEKMFHLKENNTTVKTEVVAGIATFLTSVYVVAVSPVIYSAAGMDKTATFWACTLTLIFMSLVYAFWINYPFHGGPSIGVSPWFAYYIVTTLGVPWQVGLTSVFISGILFMLLSIVGFREKILMAIPLCIKHAFGAGIGAFITTVGLLNSGIIKIDSGSFFGLTLGDLTNPPTFLAILAILIICFFTVKKLKGGFLVGILAMTVAGFFVMDPKTGTALTQWGGKIVSFTNPIDALSPTLFKCFTFEGAHNAFSNVWLGLGVITFTLFFICVFDTIGTVSGLSALAGFTNKETGEIPKMKKIFMADALGTTVASMLGCTTTVTFVESSVGVAEGGRTGLTSLVIAALYGGTLFFAPLFTIIPVQASGAAVSVIGALMLKSVLEINLEDFTEAMPAFFCIFMMPFTGNMGTGILIGIFLYSVLKAFNGKIKEVNPVLWILSAVFVVYVIAQSMI